MLCNLELQAISKNHHILAAADYNINSVAIGMVRNESDIISSWLSYVLASFDKILLIDHMSTDGTFEFLSEAANIFPDQFFLYRFAQPGYYQAELTNELAVIASHAFPHAWIMPLDADEFIESPGGEHFSDIVSPVDVNKAVSFPWRTIIPYNVRMDNEFDVHAPFLFSPNPAPYLKCGVNAQMILKHDLKFTQGNHAFNNEIDIVQLRDMAHVPLRSLNHLMLKCVQGCVAYESIAKTRPTDGQGFHWFQMLRMAVDSGGIDENQLRYIAHNYGENNDDLKGLSIYDLVDNGWDIKPLSVPILPHRIKLIRRNYIQLMDGLIEKIKDPRIQTMVANFNKYDLLSYDGTRIKTLPVKNDQENDLLNITDINFLTKFIAPSFCDIERLVPSAWSEHIPFLFCLLEYLKPRRFVELGTHFGGCFFAACQISKNNDNNIECIAIDTWKGDEHAGEYGDEVFDQFFHILKTDYQSCGHYIRKDFNDAASLFEPGSIDILHIDGLHTYEAVKNDYEIWHSKLSTSGIIMLHDTHVLERGFGVYRLWDELRELFYPSFHFEHGHGLGLIYVGSEQTSTAALFKILENHDVGNFLRQFFSLQGKNSITKTEMQMRGTFLEAAIKDKDLQIRKLEAGKIQHTESCG